ncbi:hypothetical protein [Actinocatenispora sera]|uniref:Uncharacterized protein n=1 Tax=Actinocatenispora sera TaxID=390989 RepID=A0A810KUM3_9ACTN|nr:hypothetical protein [Actinocatenispora sera]BCJ26059.1 hypothetical protein Asera_01670 [Actinocatenispora sera]
MTELAQLARRLVGGTAHWSPGAWAARITPTPDSAGEPGATRHRADVLYDLVQQLADLGAEAESRPARPVPRLDNDLALPDQLWVVATDLADAPRPVLTRAEAALRATHRTLFPEPHH